jgi:hypothetical protein
MTSEQMWMLIIHGISVFWTIALVPRPCCPSKAKPMLAAFAGTIAPVTQVIRSVIALGAVIVELMLEMFFAAVLAHDQWLSV